MSNGVSLPVRLLVGTENIWALDSHLQTRLIVPVAGTPTVSDYRDFAGTGLVSSAQTISNSTTNDWLVQPDDNTKQVSVSGAVDCTFATPADGATLSTDEDTSTPGFELPFVVQGPWDDPLVFPDPESLIRRSPGAAPLLDAVKDRKTRDAVRSVIERITGGGTRPAAPAAAPAAAESGKTN